MHRIKQWQAKNVPKNYFPNFNKGPDNNIEFVIVIVS